MPRKWLIVLLLGLAACLNYVARMMPTTMHTSLVAALHMSEAQFALIISGFLWIYGIFNPFAGFLADRFSRSAVLITSCLIWSGSTCLIGLAGSFHQLLAMRLLMGVSEACFFPSALALVADYHGPETRSLATGLLMTGASFGAALGGIGGWLAQAHTWNFAFVVVGAASMIHSILLLAFLRDPKRHVWQAGPKTSAGSFSTALAHLLSNRPVILLFLAFGLASGVSWIMAGWMPTYLGEHLRLGQAAAGMSFTGYTYIAGLGGLIAGGIWADRWSARRGQRARLWVPILGLAIAAPGMLLAVYCRRLPYAVPGLILFGLAGGFCDSTTMPLLCLTADSRYRATAYGIINLISTILGGAAIYAVGILRDWKVDLSSVLAGAVAVQVLCAGILAWVRISDSAEA